MRKDIRRSVRRLSSGCLQLIPVKCGKRYIGAFTCITSESQNAKAKFDTKGQHLCRFIIVVSTIRIQISNLRRTERTWCWKKGSSPFPSCFPSLFLLADIGNNFPEYKLYECWKRISVVVQLLFTNLRFSALWSSLPSPCNPPKFSFHLQITAYMLLPWDASGMGKASWCRLSITVAGKLEAGKNKMETQNPADEHNYSNCTKWWSA